jgi:hypothetical protein
VNLCAAICLTAGASIISQELTSNYDLLRSRLSFVEAVGTKVQVPAFTLVYKSNHMGVSANYTVIVLAPYLIPNDPP